ARGRAASVPPPACHACRPPAPARPRPRCARLLSRGPVLGSDRRRAPLPGPAGAGGGSVTLRVGVVGAGIVGLAVARRLIETNPDIELTVLDKEDRVGTHQTARNSGVAHAGVYYVPGSLKATLCRRGIGLLKAYCAERGVAYDECGKVIVARSCAELPRLWDIEARAIA